MTGGQSRDEPAVETTEPPGETTGPAGETAEPVDGRVARRQRNIEAVLDVVLEMFAEDSMVPTIEQAAARSGLSLRSLYRYFEDPAELLEATIKRSNERLVPLAMLPGIGEGPLAERIDDFVAMRLRLHDAAAPVFRATVVNAVKHRSIRDELMRSRNLLREQLGLQFAPELAKLAPAERRGAETAADIVTQLDSIDYLRRHLQLSAADTSAVLTSALRTLLG